MDQNNQISKTNFNINYVFETNIKEINTFSNNIDIETVTNFKEFKKFYNFPFQLYNDNTFWVSPFWKEQKDFFKTNNPFWTHAECMLYVAKKNGKIVGRIAAIIDYKFCVSVGKKIGYFGFFECIEDDSFAKALFESAQNWLISKNMTVMRGPIDGRIDKGCGFLYKGFNMPQTILSSYSPSYYISFAEKFNMKKARDLLIYYIDLKKPLPKKLKEKSNKCVSSDIVIRRFNRLRTGKEMKWWIPLFLEAFEDHWGYAPVSQKEVRSRFGVKQLRWFVDSKLFLVAMSNGSPVAFIWSTPDYNQLFKKMNGHFDLFQILKFYLYKHKINIGKLHIISVKKEFCNRNIGSCLNYKTLFEMKNRGYVGAEVGLIDEGNAVANTTIAITGAKEYKRFRVFEKKLHSK
jgi:hypothetical protein